MKEFFPQNDFHGHKRLLNFKGNFHSEFFFKIIATETAGDQS